MRMCLQNQNDNIAPCSSHLRWAAVGWKGQMRFPASDKAPRPVEPSDSWCLQQRGGGWHQRVSGLMCLEMTNQKELPFKNFPKTIWAIHLLYRRSRILLKQNRKSAGHRTKQSKTFETHRRTYSSVPTSSGKRNHSWSSHSGWPGTPVHIKFRFSQTCNWFLNHIYWTLGCSVPLQPPCSFPGQPWPGRN